MPKYEIRGGFVEWITVLPVDIGLNGVVRIVITEVGLEGVGINKGRFKACWDAADVDWTYGG